MGVNTDGEEMGPGSSVTDGLEHTETACEFEQQHEHGQSLTQDADCDVHVGIQDQKPAKGTGIPLITSLQNISSQHTSGALNTEHNEAQREHTDGRDSVLSNTLFNLNTDTSAYDKCVQLGKCSLSLQPAEILETDTNDAWYSMYNTLNEISLSDASVFELDLPFNPNIDQKDEKGYRAKGTGIPLITTLQNMPSQHISGALNTEHNEAQIEHTDGVYNLLSDTPTLLRPDADTEDEKIELSRGALVNANTDTSADDKCLKFEECSSSLQPEEIILDISETDTNDDSEAKYDTLLDEISPSDASAFKLELPFNPDIDQMDKEGYTPLYKAALEGHLEGVEDLISRGANPNKPSKGGRSPLHAATQEGHTHIVDFLILQEADVNVGCDLGHTPLHIAAVNGYADIVEMFISEGSDVNKVDAKGWTPFNAAVQYGHLEAVKYLMTEEVKQNSYDGMTPLYAAAQCGHLDIVKYFVSKGADVNKEEDKGNIPLHGAAVRGHVEVMEYLIQQGSDVNKKDNTGWTPFNAAVQNGQLGAMKYLVTKGAKQNIYAGNTPLHAAAECDHLGIVKFCISEGADVNEETDQGKTPLHAAAARGHLKVMEYLILQGSDVNKGSVRGWTPFNAAVRYGHLEAVKYLMTKGAKQSGYARMTPLYAAARLGHLLIIKFFISKGADVNEECRRGQIPLHGAAIHGNIGVMEYLILKGSDVNKKDNNEWTPFNAAVRYGHLQAVKYLMTKGAKQNSYSGTIPLYAAAESGHLDIVQFFISKGANVNAEDAKGMIPLHGAAARGHIQIMEYLIQQGSDVNKGNANGWTPFNAAVQYGHLQAVKYLMTKGAKQNRYDGMTPLYVAAGLGHLDTVKFFISKGADVNEEDDDGMIPLHGAAAGGHMKVMEYLIQQGSDINKEDVKDLTPFNAAVQNGHLEAVKNLMTKGVKQAMYDGMTPLYAAAYFDHLHIVKFFISKGADVNEVDDKGRIPLHGAAIRCRLKVMEYLIQQGSDVNKADAEGCTPFNAAVRYGLLEAVKYLVYKEAKQNMCLGRTPLYAAARFGHLDIVKFLISKGAEVNEENENGKIPLHGAASRGHMEVMKYLIQQGSDVSKTDNTGWTPFNAAVQYGKLESVKYLLTKGVKENRYCGIPPLHGASRSGHFDVVNLFISKGADVNEEDDKGKIPLHAAAARGQMKMMEYLLQQGSDVNKSDAKGWTPFNAAVKYGHIEAVKYLITKGAEQSRYAGVTPLYVAARFGHLDIVKLFIDEGADVNEKDVEGMIPLHGAAVRGHVKVMEHLIQQGSDVNKADYRGWTPLHGAVRNGHLDEVKSLVAKGALGTRYDGLTPLYIATQYEHDDVVKFLVSNGYDVNERNEYGKSPLHAGCYNGSMDIVKFLVHKNAHCNEQDDDGWTPLHAAAQEGHQHIVDYLVLNGADMDVRDIEGLTPLQAARNAGHSIVFESDTYNEHPRCLQADARNLITSGSVVLETRDAETQSCEGKSTSQIGNVDNRNDCTQGDIAKRGADELSLKKLSTRTHADDKDAARRNVNEHVSPRRGDRNEEDTGDPLSDDHHYDAKHFATKGYAAKKKVVEMKETYTESRAGQLASQVDNAKSSNDCSRADNANRGADKLFLKDLHTRVDDDEKACNGEHNPFSHAKLKYPDKGKHDPMLDQMEANKSTRTRKRDTISNGTDCSSPLAPQTRRHSGFDPPFPQTMETDGHPSEELESRCHSLIDENMEMRKSPSPMHDGSDLQINETPEIESFPRHPSAAVHQQLYDGNPVSTQGTSSNQVWKIGNKRRTSVDWCPSSMALVQTVLQMIIALAILLAGSPVLVAGSGITERVTLQAGKPGVVPFFFQWPHNTKSRDVPYFTLRFESKSRPFYINGEITDIEGFKSPSQEPRFSTSVTDLDTSPCVNLMIDNVDTVDEDRYLLTVVWHSFENVKYETIQKEVDVQTPPGRAKCFITLSEIVDYPYEVHCRATTGSVTTTLSCYLNDQEIDVNITDTGQVTRGRFFLLFISRFSCCSHYVTLHVSKTMCNDFEWPPNMHDKQTTSQTVNTAPTLVTNNISRPAHVHTETTPTPYIELKESQIGSGTSKQIILHSALPVAYLLIYLTLLIMM